MSETIEHLLAEPLATLEAEMNASALTLNAAVALMEKGARVCTQVSKAQGTLVLRNKNLKEQLTTAVAEVGTANTAIANLELEVQTLRTEKTSAQKRIEELTNEVKETKKVSTKRKFQVADLSNQVDGLQENIRQETVRRHMEQHQQKKICQGIASLFAAIKEGVEKELPDIITPRTVSKPSTVQAPFAPFGAAVEAVTRVDPCAKKFDLSGKLGELHDEDLIAGDLKTAINDTCTEINKFVADLGKTKKWFDSEAAYEQIAMVLGLCWMTFFDAYCVNLLTENEEGLALLRVELLFNQFVEHCFVEHYDMTTKTATNLRLREHIPEYSRAEMEAYEAMKAEYLKRFDNDLNGIKEPYMDLAPPVFNPACDGVWLKE